MPALNPPPVQTGWKAAPFNLPGTDGRTHSLDSVKGKKGTLVMFICNHCPFVKAVIDDIIRDARELRNFGINTVAIMSNDVVNYPDDSFDNMKRLAEAKGFPFPYLLDESQAVAKTYGAVCTPDFFGFDGNLQLQYRGRLNRVTPSNPSPDAERELFKAMVQVAETGRAPKEQHASIGCSIKWKA